MSGQFSSLIRPAYEQSPELAGTVQQVQGDPASAAELQQQIAFDDKVVAAIRTITLSDAQTADLERSLNEVGSRVERKPALPPEMTTPPAANQSPSPGPTLAQSGGSEDTLIRSNATVAGGQGEPADKPPGGAPRRTILAAVGVGLIATCAMIIWVIADQLNSFTGSERIGQLLESADNLNGDEFEPVDSTGKDVEDWFFLKHGLEHFGVPAQFADAKTLGGRVFKFDGVEVGEIVAVGEKKMLFYLFPAAEVGVKVHNGKWNIVEDGSWIGAVTGMNDTAFVVAIRGTRQDMEQILAKK